MTEGDEVTNPTDVHSRVRLRDANASGIEIIETSTLLPSRRRWIE